MSRMEQGQADEVARTGRRIAAVCLVILSTSVATFLAACSKHDSAEEATSQVVAQVNDKEISVHQVQALMEMQPSLAQQFGEKAPSRVLDSLIEQELAAQAARSAGLDTTPKVVQAMELAKREVLARAYQDHLASKATMPDDVAINRYYDEHPELFAQRKQYMLQETMVKAKADQLKSLKEQIPKLGSAADVNALVSKSGLPNSVRNSAQWAEALPMDLLSKLASRKPGQSVLVDRPDGLIILTVVGSESAPVLRGQASLAIREALWATNRKDLIKQGMASLRQQAKIKRFDEPASAPASTPAP